MLDALYYIGFGAIAAAIYAWRREKRAVDRNSRAMGLALDDRRQLATLLGYRRRTYVIFAVIGAIGGAIVWGAKAALIGLRP